MITRYTVPTELPDTKSQNVKDFYKGNLAADIRAAVADSRSDAVLVLQNVTHDFNKSTAIRINNCFLGKEVYLVGKRSFDKRGTVGQHHYQDVYHADTFTEVFDRLKSDGYHVVAVDNLPDYDPVDLWDYEFPRKTAFVFGEEQQGLDDETIRMCDGMVFIGAADRGVCRSLNVASAAAVVLSEYSRQHRS